MTGAPHGRGWGHCLVGIGLNAVLFAGIGPAIGTSVVGAVTAITATGAPMTGFAVIYFLVGTFFLSLPLGYMLAWKAALAAGAAVAVLTTFVRDPRFLYALAVVTGAAAALVLVPMGAADSRFSEVGLGLAVAGAVAALVCTRLAVGLRLSRPAETAAG